ncbi:citrate synthase [Candidatus Marinamargulisbacteria bacterium SCGC AG-343-D04]|nr:citrate synthase [Candidatus Marinamargulisbacteria bacterium SCGC AG-343-D04]
MTEEQLRNLRKDIVSNNTISADYYSEFDVKRGLRNADGSGVLAGLTYISSVVGSKKTDQGLLPVEGVLKYRGQSLADVVAQYDETDTHFFEKVCFLLLVGRWPSEEEEKWFRSYMAQHRNLPEPVLNHVIQGIKSNNIMNKLQLGISALYAYDETPDSVDPVENLLKGVRIIAKLPMIVAYSYFVGFKSSAKYVKPSIEMSQAEAFLHVLYEGKAVSSFERRIVDLSLVLHAEHGGGNNSTFTSYVVSSSGSDIYSTLAAAVASLKGPLHGAANKKVMEMMADIKGNVSDWADVSEVKQYLKKLVLKEAGDKSGKLYGLGHAVYTKSDPRAVIIKELVYRIACDVDREREYNLYTMIADVAPQVFQEVKGSDKVISPNVDFYSGFVYDCLGIPQEIYTPLFAMARACGWCAHRLEELLSGKRIIRPGYKFVAPK